MDRVNMKPLSRVQAAVLETYIDLILENGVPPTVRAVCDRLGYIHPASVHVPLGMLVKKGYLVKADPFKAYRVVKDKNGRHIRLTFVIDETQVVKRD